MTYVTEQTPLELRAHMRRLKAMAGWHEPLADRLYKEIIDLDADIARLTKCLAAANSNAEEFERKWYLLGDEIARLREMLAGDNGALSRMERARGWLTDDNPRSVCNWGVLDTEDMRAALATTTPKG